MTARDRRRIEAGVEPARTSQGERYAMNENSSVVWFRQPDEIDDPLTNMLRSGARQLLAQAVEMEAEVFLAAMKDFKLPDGRGRVVRHGHGPERTIQTGIGPVEVSSVKIRDRGAAIDGDRIRFSSAILPKWARRTNAHLSRRMGTFGRKLQIVYIGHVQPRGG